MADKNISPEKRLLKIIEGKEEVTAATVSPLAKGKKIFSVNVIKAKFAFWKDSFKKKGKNKFKLDLRAINNALQVLIFILIVVLVLSIKFNADEVNQRLNLQTTDISTAAQAQPADIVSLLKPEAYYLEHTLNRDLFSLADIPQAKKNKFKDEEVVSRTSKLGQKLKALKLVGISWSNEPDAIIEDTELEKTYFVKKGYMIDEIKVYDVLKDRVILRCEGEEIELK